MVLVVVPMLPAFANKVTPTKVHISTALSHLFAINWLYGFVASCVLYSVLNLVFPARRTLILSVIHGDIEVVQGVSSSNKSTDGDIGHAEKGLRQMKRRKFTRLETGRRRRAHRYFCGKRVYSGR